MDEAPQRRKQTSHQTNRCAIRRVPNLRKIPRQTIAKRNLLGIAHAANSVIIRKFGLGQSIVGKS